LLDPVQKLLNQSGLGNAATHERRIPATPPILFGKRWHNEHQNDQILDIVLNETRRCSRRDKRNGGSRSGWI